LVALSALGAEGFAGDIGPSVVGPSEQAASAGYETLEHHAKAEEVEPVDAALAPSGGLAVHFLVVGQGHPACRSGTVLVDTGRHDASDATGHLRRLGVAGGTVSWAWTVGRTRRRGSGPST
jgi:hypothetical protein